MYGLRPKVLTSILGETNTGGVFMSLLMQEDGSLVALAAEDRDKARNMAAIVSNIWSSYEHGSEEGLECLLIGNEEGRIAIMKASKTLVCIVGEHDVGFGMLKAKVHALVDKLEPPLN